MTDFDISQTIDDIIYLIFDCNFQEGIKKIIELIEYIEKNIFFSKPGNKEAWGQIVQYIELGFQNKDYLVISDILRCELMPLLTEKNIL